MSTKDPKSFKDSKSKKVDESDDPKLKEAVYKIIGLVIAVGEDDIRVISETKEDYYRCLAGFRKGNTAFLHGDFEIEHGELILLNSNK